MAGMIDVGKKEKTERSALATAFVKLPGEIIDKIKNNTMPKGNVLETARAAGILGAKKTWELIPLCHNIVLDSIGINYTLKEDGIMIESTAKATAKTGVEMEALTACSLAALTIYDMCKMFTQEIDITDIYLIEKKGGKSGIYKRTAIK